MNPAAVFRVVLSSVIVLLMFVAGSGWRWAGSHQPAAQAAASRTVLTLCLIAGVAGLVAVWRPVRRRPSRH